MPGRAKRALPFDRNPTSVKGSRVLPPLLFLLASLSTEALSPNSAQAQESFSSQALSENQPFFFPVQPAKIALFGPVRPPSTAASVSRATIGNGQWGMFWVPALSNVELQIDQIPGNTTDLSLLKITGSSPLNGILGFLESPLTRTSAGTYRVFNPDPTRRAFLIQSRSEPVQLRIQGQSQRVPNDAWRRAWRTFWKNFDGTQEARATWFDHRPSHPARLDFIANQLAVAQLADRFPQAKQVARWLLALKQLTWAESLRPVAAKQRPEELLCNKAARNATCDVLEPDRPFPIVHGERPLTLTIAGGTTFEIRARRVGNSDSKAREFLRIRTKHRHLGSLELYPHFGQTPPGQPLPLGSQRTLRFYLPPGEHSVEINYAGQGAQVSLRALHRSKRLSEHFANATIPRAFKRASRALRRLHRTDPHLAATLEPLLDPWRTSPIAPNPGLKAYDQRCSAKLPWLCAQDVLELARYRSLSSKSLTPRITLACDRLRQIQPKTSSAKRVQQRLLAQLASALQEQKQSQAAQSCLGARSPISNSSYLKALLDQAPLPQMGQDPLLAAGYRWLSQRRESQDLRSAFWRRWNEGSRPHSLAPARSSEAPRYRWLTPARRPQASPSKLWAKLMANQDYLLDAQASSAGSGNSTVLRLGLALSSQAERKGIKHRSVIVQIGPDRHHVELTPKFQIFSWIISPDAHFVKVHAPKDTRIYSDHSPTWSLSNQQYRHESLWAMRSEQGHTLFPLARTRMGLPLSLRLRVSLTDEPEHRRTLPLLIHNDRFEPQKLWVHYDPQSVDPALQSGDFGKASFSLPVTLGPLGGATQLWMTSTSESPKVALSVQERITIPQNLASPRPLSQGSPDEVIYSAQGPQTLQHRLSRAHRFLDAGRYSELRDELEWILLQPQARLQTQQSSLNRLLEGLAQSERNPRFSYRSPGGANARVSMRAAFLDPDPSPRHPVNHARSLELEAQSLRESKYSSISRAMLSLSNFMGADTKAEQKSKLAPLAYGMLLRISNFLKGPKIDGWLAQLAAQTHWSPIKYAEQSSGHEMVRHHPPLEQEPPSRTTQILAAPWSHHRFAQTITPGQNQVFSLQRSKKGELELQVFCRDRVPQKSQCNLTKDLPFGQQQKVCNAPLSSTMTIRRDRRSVQTLKIRPGTLERTKLWVFSGSNRIELSIQGRPDRLCGFMLFEKDQRSDRLTPLAHSQSRRWFVSTPNQTVALHAQGPGVIKLSLRSLSNERNWKPAKLIVRSPSGRVFRSSMPVNATKDPELTLERNPNLGITHASEQLILMPQAGPYRLELQGQQAELLIRAQQRRTHPPRVESSRHPGLVRMLQSRLRTGSVPRALAVPAQSDPQLSLRESVHSTQWPTKLGIWDISGRAGFQADSEYEETRPRFNTQAGITWTKAIWPGHLWNQTSLQISSENRIRPAMWLQSRVYAAHSGIFAQVALRGAIQPLNRWAHGLSAWARLGLSTRKLFAPHAHWDLRPELRFSYRGFSRATQDIVSSRYSKGLHASIYRRYILDHPFSLRPRIELKWRRFYDLRATLGQDLWLNANFASVDRVRGWLNLTGLLDPFERWNRTQWTYKLGYRFSFAPEDQHRKDSFSRHELSLGLSASWRVNRSRRWTLAANNTLILQPKSDTSNRFMLSARLSFDASGPLFHRPPYLKPFPHELKTSPWTHHRSAKEKIDASISRVEK